MNASGPTRKMPNANQNIQVYLRVRPTNNRERTIRSMEVVEVPNSKEVIARQFVDAKTSKKFTFDKAFGPESKQNEVYATVVAPLIDEVLAGYNCTVFAYGQTGTGKTFTMVGEERPELGLSWEDDGPIGIIPRALSHLFDELRATELEFSMRVSYLELYNEELCDLLSTDDTVKIRIFDDSTKKGSVIVQGLEEIPVHNKDDVYKLLAKGQERRKTASTLMNAQSSRSHTVFSILVHIRENGIDGEEMLKIGKLNLVDLAGSENISKAGNEKGIRHRETVNINQSLLTLGRVITALVEKTPHVPYRESKLTRLLQESLGGRTKTSIIATISPGHKDLEETLSTLDYAHRAKNIQNKPEINQRLTKKTVLKEYTEEIDKLKRDLMAARDKNGVYLAHETYEDMVFKIESSNKELTEKQDKIKVLKEELSKQVRLFDEISYNLIERTEELAQTDAKLKTTEANLQLKRRNLRKAKQRYDEKKTILSHHVKTEEVLTQQARELISTAQKASTDVAKLHETIDRRCAAESQMETSCQQFSNGLQVNLNEANETLAQFHEKFNTKSQMIKSELKGFEKEHHTWSTMLLSLVEQSKMLNNVGAEKIQQQMTTNQKNFNKNLDEIHNATTQFNKDMKTFTDKSNFNFQEVMLQGFATMQVQLNQISAKQKQIIDAICSRDEEFTKFSSNLKQKLVCIEEKSKEIQIENNKMKEIQQLGAKLFGDLSNHLTSVQENVKIVQNCTQTAKQSVDKIEQSPFFQQQNDFHAEMEELVSETQNGAEENSKKIVMEMASFTKTVENKTEIFAEAIKKKLNENLAHNLVENHKILVKHNAESTAQLEGKFAEINAEVEKIKHGSKNHVTNSESLLDSTNNLTNSFKETLNGQIRKISDATEHFRREEVKTYKATGETPGRQQYKIEKDLAQTLPHERIIRKFRLDGPSVDLDSSATFSECDEDCSMLSESQTDNSVFLVNSTPFREGVTERKNLSDPHLSQILGLSAISEEDKENFTN